MAGQTEGRKILIQRDVHFVRYDRWGNGTEYPDGYEISGKWEVREDVAWGSEAIECCLTLGEAKAFAESGDVVEVDRAHWPTI